MADVHPEDGYLCVLHEVDGAQHRAVATEADGERDVLGELVVGHREIEEADGLGVGERHAHLVATFVQPLHGLARELERVDALVVHDERHRAHRRLASATT